MSGQSLKQLAVAAPTIRLMNEDFRLQCVATGCEPTCHFCDKPIALGESFGFRRINEAGFTQGVYEPGRSAMGCENCISNATPEQMAHAMRDALQRSTHVPPLDLTLDGPSPIQRSGCFISDDGVIS